MKDTRNERVEFGQTAFQQNENNLRLSTWGGAVDRQDGMKVIQKSSILEISIGYLKVNFSDRNKQEAYRKINKMLGGN